MFNHEWPHRGETFVTRKITRGLANIARGLDRCLYMGNLDSVREFITWSAAELGITLRFEALGVDEKAYVAAIFVDSAPALTVGDCVVAVDARYFRPAEVETLLSDPTKAKTKLGWVPEITAQTMTWPRPERRGEPAKAAQIA